MIKSKCYVTRIFEGIVVRKITFSNVLMAELQKVNQWNHPLIKDILLKAGPGQKITLSSNSIRNYMKACRKEIDLKTKLRLLEIMAQQVINAETFRHFCDLMFEVNDSDINSKLYIDFKIRFFQNLVNLDPEITFRIIKYFKRMTQNFRIDDLRKIFVQQLQKLNKEQIFVEFLKSEYLTNSIFYGILKSPNDNILLDHKSSLFLIILNCGVVLSPRFERVFESEVEKLKISSRLANNIDYSQIRGKSIDFSQAYFTNFRLVQLLHWKVNLREDPEFASFKLPFNYALEYRCQLEKDNLDSIFDVFVYFTILGNIKMSSYFAATISYYISDLKEMLFDEPNTKWIFENHIYVIKKMVTSLEKMKNYSDFPKSQKDPVNIIMNASAEFIERMALEQDLAKAFADLEDLKFKQSRLGEIKYRLKSFDLDHETIDCVLFIFHSLIEINCSSLRFFKGMHVLISDLIPQMSISQFSKALECFCNSNYLLEDIADPICDYIKTRILATTGSLDQLNDPVLELNIVYFLTLVNRFEEELILKISKNFRLNYKRLDILNFNQRVILFLIQQIYRTSHFEIFRNLQVELPQGFVILPRSDYSDRFIDFFNHLFYRNLKENEQVGVVNVHFSQDSFALMCVDYPHLNSETGSVKGVVLLVKKYLETIYKEVGVISIHTTDAMSKKNEEMHELRTITKKWKIDFDARENHYRKFTDGVSSHITQSE